VEKSKREMEEQMARFGMQDSAGNRASEGGPGPSSTAISDIMGLLQDLFGEGNSGGGAGPSNARH
jgi:hypothetical protein